MLSVNQSGIKDHFWSIWYDSTWNWTQLFQAICEHSNHYANKTVKNHNLHESIFKPKLIHWILINSLVCRNFLQTFIFHAIGPAVRVFANGPGDLGSIPGRVIPKTLKMELDTTLLNTQHYKVRFKGKVEQSREWSSALPYTLV